MANEITAVLSLNTRNGTLIHQFNPGVISVTQTTARVYDSVHIIGTSEETISAFGDIAAPTIIILYNMDATNYVQWGFATGVYGSRLFAAHVPNQFTYETGASIFIKANTAACNVRVIALEL